MSEDKTVTRTLWTDTLFDLLATAIKRNNETEAKKLLKEIRAKGYRRERMMQHMQKHLEAAQISQLKRLVSATFK